MNTIKEKILNLEQMLLQENIRKSAKEVNKILSDDFIEFCSSGTIYNYKIGDTFYSEEKIDWEIKEFEIKFLSTDCIIATYNLTKHNELEIGKKYSLRSSIWKSFNGNWKMIFHQGTPILNF